jgi:hypothetical protein
MNAKIQGWTLVCWTVPLTCALLLASCGGRANREWQPEPVTDPKLDAAYSRMLVLPVDIDAQTANDYPQVAADCRDGLVVGLETSKRFQVQLVDTIPVQAERDTLVVKLAISDVRIVSRSTRFWAGVAVGNSYINVKMTLTDGYTGQVIRDKEFSTDLNIYTPSNAFMTNFRDEDRPIPKIMGHIIGDYITAVMQ